MSVSPKNSSRTFNSPVEAVSEIGALLRDSSNQRFLICGHVRPDGDCMGSVTAMGRYLAGLGKDVRFFFRGPVQENLLGLLPDEKAPSSDFPEDFEADVTVCVDSADTDRIVEGFLEKARGTIVNIDHHVSNTLYGDLNWVDAKAAAAGEMLCHFFDADPMEWTPEIASALYFAIQTDTGGFRYRNTTAATFQAAARLVEKGADPAALAEIAYGGKKLGVVRITAEVLSNLHFELDGRMVWAEITQDLFGRNGGEENDPENLSGDLRGIEGVEVAVLLREKSDGTTRASFRSDGKVDVGTIAGLLGGGGHRAASGLDLNEEYEAAKPRIIETVRCQAEKQLDETAGKSGSGS